VKILLDENMPESLADALENLGHEVDSVNHLKLKGIDNGTLYRQVAVNYELCFSRDAGFVHNLRQMRDPAQVKVLRVVIAQQRVESFVPVSSMLFKSPIGCATRTATIGPSSQGIFLNFASCRRHSPGSDHQPHQWFGFKTVQARNTM
jgi:predicted nuclease of predicted toxin-antitoxin system